MIKDKRFRRGWKCRINTARRRVKNRIKRYIENVGKRNILREVCRKNNKLKGMINNTLFFYCGHAESKPDGQTLVSFRGSQVFCTELGCHLWQRVEIRTYENDKECAKDLLQKLLKELPIKRFVDEDGQMGIFRKNIDDGRGKRQVAYCYLNPDFKYGYFENHTLETEFINII